MPEARAFCASAISSSTFLPTIIIMSASSSTITTMNGSGSSSGTSFGFFRTERLHQQRIADRLAGFLHLLQLAIEPGEVTHAERGHQLMALHLGHAPAQRVGCFLHVRDDRRQQVRNALARPRAPASSDRS